MKPPGSGAASGGMGSRQSQGGSRNWGGTYGPPVVGPICSTIYGIPFHILNVRLKSPTQHILNLCQQNPAANLRSLLQGLGFCPEEGAKNSGSFPMSIGYSSKCSGASTSLGSLGLAISVIM